jgi:phage-related protein
MLDTWGRSLPLIVDVFGAAIKGIIEILSGLITFLTGVFTGDWDKAWDGLVQIFDGVVGILAGIGKFLWKTLLNLFNNGGKQILGAVKDWWTGVIQSFVNAQARVLLSVSRWVVNVVQGFVTLRARAVDSMRSMWTRISTSVANGVVRLRNSVGRGIDRVVGTFTRLPGQIVRAVGNLGSLLYNAGRNVVQGLIDGIGSMLSGLASQASRMAGTIRNYLPFSPAKEGPLSGLGNPEQSGRKIAEMIGEGITQNVNVPARAMNRALAPLASSGQALEPLRRTAGTPGTSSAVAAAQRPSVSAGDVTVQQIFTGPTSSGGRLQEINWNVRYATQARRETIGGVAT